MARMGHPRGRDSIMEILRKRAGRANAGEAEGWAMALGSWGRRRSGNFLRYAIAGAMVAACGLLVMSGGQRSSAQETKSAAPAQAGGDQVARGKYIVEDVAMCGTCHTPRLPNGAAGSQPVAGRSSGAVSAGAADCGLADQCAATGGDAAGDHRGHGDAADHHGVDGWQTAARSYAQVSHDARGCRGGGGVSAVAAVARATSVGVVRRRNRPLVRRRD